MGKKITPAFPSRSHSLGSHPANASRDAYDADNILKQTTTNKQMEMENSFEVIK